MSFIAKLLIWCFCACLLVFRVEARWKPEYGDRSHSGHYSSAVNLKFLSFVRRTLVETSNSKPH
jgi:hypothetical protein